MSKGGKNSHEAFETHGSHPADPLSDWGRYALAQDEWQLCSPEEVDVSGVQEINGRLVGEIALPESAGHIRLMVDCPVPEPFTAQQQAVLTVRYQEVTKGDLSAAIEAARAEREGRKAGAVLQ